MNLPLAHLAGEGMRLQVGQPHEADKSSSEDVQLRGGHQALTTSQKYHQLQCALRRTGIQTNLGNQAPVGIQVGTVHQQVVGIQLNNGYQPQGVSQQQGGIQPHGEYEQRYGSQQQDGLQTRSGGFQTQVGSQTPAMNQPYGGQYAGGRTSTGNQQHGDCQITGSFVRF